jgi:hypothetical protein
MQLIAGFIKLQRVNAKFLIDLIEYDRSYRVNNMDLEILKTSVGAIALSTALAVQTIHRKG